MIERISFKALKRLLQGDVGEDAVCVVKFYSNGCHLCHALKFKYEGVVAKFENTESLYFFAFNVDDAPDLANHIKIDGTPSIAAIYTGKNRRVDLMGEPPKPDPQTWYTERDIENFINKASR